MILELCVDTFITCIATIGVINYFQNKKNQPVAPMQEQNVVPWLQKEFTYLDKTPSGKYGVLTTKAFQCPKCQGHSIYDGSGAPNYCECLEYHTEHFHYKCPGCKFTSIMKTADNS